MNVNNKIQPQIIQDESTLYSLWQSFCSHKQISANHKLKGLEAGQLNTCEGPDFQGAEFELNGKVYRGDVEIHKKSSDWFAHGHHLDNRYDRVVLHLVWQDSPIEVKNSKNQIVPSLSLKSLHFSVPQKNNFSNCILNMNYKSDYNVLMKNLALKRLLLKGKEIDNLISDLGIEQSLYRLMLISLGYTKNRDNYERISTLIPWQFITQKKEKYNPPLEYWLALFLGVSGLLNIRKQIKLNAFWQKIFPEIQGKILKKAQWKYGGIRPNNHPEIRLAGLATYIHRMKETSLFQNISNIFYDRLDYSIVLKKLFGELSEISNPAEFQIRFPHHLFWGKNLILEIIGNVFVPFLFSMTKENMSFGFAEYLKQFYFYLPATTNYGRLKPLYNRNKSINTGNKFFYINQALLHLQNSYCKLDNCEICPLRLV